MENKVEFGFERFAYQVISDTVTKPVLIPGAVEMSVSVDADTYEFEADNRIYYTRIDGNKLSGELVVALLPDQFLIDVLGYTKLSDGGLAQPLAGAVKKSCHIMAEGSGDAEKRHFVWLNVEFGVPSDADLKTGKEVRTATIPFTVLGAQLPSGELIARIKYKKDDAGYETIYTNGIDVDTLSKEVEGA